MNAVTKVKLISSSNLIETERQVNDFLSDPNIQMRGMMFSTTVNTFDVMIIYT
jgi:hypothetical protein